MTFDSLTPRLGATALIGAFTLLIGGASLAMGQDMAIDTDGDGMVSFTELMTLMPAMTEAEFQALDADADGLLNADEIAAAQEAGLVPAG